MTATPPHDTGRAHEQAGHIRGGSTRALAPDFARGLMLLGIALANVSVFFWGRPMFDGLPHPVDGSLLDRILAVVAMLLIEQRTYPLFAFLFGYGIVQFMRSREERGMPETVVRQMLRRRHLWLIVFGAVHAALLFEGDILGAYGLAGLILVAIFARSSDRALMITVWIFVGLSAVGALLLWGLGAVTAMLPPELLGDPALINNAVSGTANYGIAILIRLGAWIVATPLTVLTLVVPTAILLGMLAGRHRWLELRSSRPALRTVAFWGMLIGVVGAVPTALVYLGVLPGFAHAGWAFLGVTQVTGLAGGIGWAALFGLIGTARQGRAGAPMRAISAVGKRSLSSYLLQSIAFAPLFAAWGFGLGATVSTAGAYAIALAVWLASVVFAVLLERRGLRGPAEAVLRRLTYGRDAAASPTAAR